MAGRHGTRRRYNDGCRCDDCTANRVYVQEYRQRPTVVVPLPAPATPQTGAPPQPGPVESGVHDEISDLAAEARPGLAQVALALARLMDNPRAVNQQPAAAKALASLLEKLRSASARGRRGNLALMRTMAAKGGA